MFSAKRLAVFSIAAAALPLLVFGEAIAGGGFLPNFPPDLGLTSFNTSGQVTAVIVLDPNGPVSSGAPATPTGPFGTIVITRQNVGTATATFEVQPGSSLGELRFGCNLLLTNSRFVEFAPGVPGFPLGGPGAGFGNWLSTDVTVKLFSQLGATIADSFGNPLMIPGVAGVISQKCVAFPKANKTLDFLMLNEILDKQHIKPLPPTYPDLTIPGVTDPTQQWSAGFLVLEVNVGFWAAPGTPTP